MYHAFQRRLLVTALGALGYALLASGNYRHAVVCFALQSMLFAVSVPAPCFAVRHPAIYTMSLEEIWRAFTERHQPCVYVIASLHHRGEYVGSTCDWRGRLYSHVRHVLRCGAPGEQYVHRELRRWPCEYAFVPVARLGGGLLEDRLIRTFAPTLNRHGVAPAARRAPQPASAAARPRARRLRRQRALADPPSPCTYSTLDGATFLLLFDVLTTFAQNGGYGLVYMSQGAQWLDHSKLLLRCFGSCLATCAPLGAVDQPLATLWQPLKALSCTQCLVFCVVGAKRAHPFALTRAVLVNLLADRSTVRALYRAPQHTLITLMHSAQQFCPVKSRAELCGILAYVFKRRYALSLRHTPVIRVPWGLHQLAPLVTQTAKQVLGSLALTKALAAWYCSRLRVVCTAGVSIARLLHNHRATAKSATLADLLSSRDDGFCISGSALQGHPVLGILDTHTGVYPPGSFQHAAGQLCEQLCTMCRRLTGTPPADAAARVQQVWRSAAPAARCAASELRAAYARCGVPPLGTWLRLKHAITACDLVCMPLDRDPHRLALCTRSGYVARLAQLFLHDTKHYSVCARCTPAQLIASWHLTFDQHRWLRFGKFDARGTLPYAYYFPKAKNLQRSRVIVSCAGHPLRRILHPLGCILIRLLCRCAFTHFNLYSLAELTTCLHAFSATLDPADVLLCLSTDVKEMYTGMRHAETLDAMRFMIDRCKSVLRSQYVSIGHGADAHFFVGRKRAARAVCFHLDDLLPLVRFELENLYFTLGTDVILHQVVGAAMGGFTSPACAQCVASVAEYRNMHAFLASSSLFARRYMDDTFALINLSAVARTHTSLGTMLRRLFHMYDPAGLEVEQEFAGTSCTVLQSRISVHGGLQCAFWNKNADVACSGRQRVRRMLPCIAQSSAAQRALMTGILHRMLAATIPSSIHLLLPSLLELRCELAMLGYSPLMFDRRVRDFAMAQRFAASFTAWHSLYMRYHAKAAVSHPPGRAACLARCS